jgi:hypothetical protein
MGERVLNQTLWNGVTEIPPPTLQDKRAYVDRYFRQPAARSVFLCRLKWR